MRSTIVHTTLAYDTARKVNTMRQLQHTSFGPGKFEGEACYTRIAHFWILEGMGGYDSEDEYLQRIDGPFTLQEVEEYERETGDSLCQDCLADLLEAKAVYEWEDSQGFAYSSLA